MILIVLLLALAFVAFARAGLGTRYARQDAEGLSRSMVATRLGHRSTLVRMRRFYRWIGGISLVAAVVVSLVWLIFSR